MLFFFFLFNQSGTDVRTSPTSARWRSHSPSIKLRCFPLVVISALSTMGGVRIWNLEVGNMG